MISILVYTENLCPRASYVFKFIFEQYANVEINFTDDVKEYSISKAICITYSKQHIRENEFFVFESGNLYISSPEISDIQSRYSDDELQLFPSENGFDLIASIFFVLSRMEEYAAPKLDQHQRFTSNSSVLQSVLKCNVPIVDSWASKFVQNLESHFSIKLVHKGKYNFELGVDIDFFWKYKNKRFRNLFGLLKDLSRFELQKCKQRMDTIFGQRKDPFDTYAFFEELGLQKSNLLFFILSGGNSIYDRNISIRHPEVMKLISSLRRFATIGIHPSYNAALDKQLLSKEINGLTAVSNELIDKSRFHYIRMQLPLSYRHLIDQNIFEDYSMGYADKVGFRAGTSQVHYWFDIERNEQTNLKLFPFIAMDRTLLSYMKLGNADALLEIKKMIDQVRFYNGNFHLIWHNSSFDECESWSGYEELLKEIVAYGKV